LYQDWCQQKAQDVFAIFRLVCAHAAMRLRLLMPADQKF
jgi:hypothetical protein